MASNWALPTIIDQFSEEGNEDYHVPWLEEDDFSSLKSANGKHVKTSRDLVHIARDPRHDILEKTYYLKLTGFEFESMPENIQGIEVRITMNRFGRIVDDTIQLCLEGEFIGENKSSDRILRDNYYGSDVDLWETNIESSQSINETFGIILRYKSHPSWPHKNSAFIDAVEIRIH